MTAPVLDRVRELRRVRAADLLAHPANWRRHPPAQRAALERVLATVGFAGALLAREDADGRLVLIDGHLRADTTPELEVPVLVLDVSEQEAELLLATYDPIGALAETNADALAELMRAVTRDDAALAAWVPQLLAAIEPTLPMLNAAENEPAAETIPALPDEPVSRVGDCWHLGPHRLVCGDARDPDVVALLGRRDLDLCFTSPPYAAQRDYENPIADWTALLTATIEAAPLGPGAQLFVNLGMVHDAGEWVPYWDEWIAALRARGWRRFGWYVWDQGPGLPGDWGGRLAPAHEFVFHFNRATRKPAKTKACRGAGEVKHLPGKRSGLRGADGTISHFTHEGRATQSHKIPDSVIRVVRHKGAIEGGSHPAVFPTRLPAEFLVAFSTPGAWCYEPFCGSGSVIIAAEQLGRYCAAIELAPRYVDVAVRRWQEFTSQAAVRAGTKQTFEDVAAQRARLRRSRRRAS